MKKKINSKFMLISAIAIIVMAICAMVLFYDILKKQIFDDLKANAHVISMMNPEDGKYLLSRVLMVMGNSNFD